MQFNLLSHPSSSAPCWPPYIDSGQLQHAVVNLLKLVRNLRKQRRVNQAEASMTCHS